MTQRHATGCHPADMFTCGPTSDQGEIWPTGCETSFTPPVMQGVAFCLSLWAAAEAGMLVSASGSSVFRQSACV